MSSVEMVRVRSENNTPSFLSKVWGQLRSYAGPWTSSSHEMLDWWRGPSSTGISVTEDSALNYSAVWAAVSLISSQVGSLPLMLYKRLPNGGKVRFSEHRTYRLLHDEPNPDMTSMVFRETLQAHVLMWGNAYAEIERDNSGRPLALWPLTPERVTPFYSGERLLYRVSSQGGRDVVIDRQDILHIPGLGFDGTTGYSVIAKARESIGLGLATEKFGGTFFGQGATFGGILSHPANPDDATLKGLREQLAAGHQGVDRAHRFLILKGGMTYERLGIPPNDAQFLETRKFQIPEICRWFNLPPHKLKDLDRSTNNNIEHQNLEYYIDCLRAWLVRWEQELNRKLISPVERNIQFCEHVVDGLLRGDTKTRYDAYSIGRQWGWLSANDICDLENLNHLPGGQGDVYLVPMNMVPADRLNEIVDKQVAPDPAPVVSRSDEDVAAAEARALTAEQCAAEARADADREREARITAEATGTATREEVTALRESEQRAVALAAQVTLLADEMRAKADALQAEKETLATSLTEETTARAEATRTADDLRTELDTTSMSLGEALRASDEAMSTVRSELAAAIAARVDEEFLRKSVEEATAIQQREAEARAVAEELLKVLAIDYEGETQARNEAVQRELAAAQARAEAEAAKAEAEQQLALQRESEQARITSVMAAHRGLIVDAMGRMIRREAEKARRHQSTPAKLRAWADTFYADRSDHELICIEALRPAIRAHLAWQQSTDDVDTVTRAYVQLHLNDSRLQLRAVLDGHDDQELPVVLDQMLQRWESHRAEMLADDVLREAVDYVGTYRGI